MAKKKMRNLHAINPIMLKGHVHEKSKGAKRAEEKKNTRRKVREWLSHSHSFYLYTFLCKF